MHITKPEKVSKELVEIKSQLDSLKSEDIEYYYFHNEKYKNINLFDIQLSHCIFSNIDIQEGKLEKITFLDVIFNNCDFSNTEFLDTSFIRCEFNNCKLAGCNLAEDRLYNVTINGTNCTYINLTMASMKNVLFKETSLRNGYFQETKIKNIYFENVDLRQAQFFKTSLKNIDLTSSNIEGIAISLEGIKGAIIEQLQVMDLIYLLGVKLK